MQSCAAREARLPPTCVSSAPSLWETKDAFFHSLKVYTYFLWHAVEAVAAASITIILPLLSFSHFVRFELTPAHTNLTLLSSADPPARRVRVNRPPSGWAGVKRELGALCSRRKRETTHFNTHWTHKHNNKNEEKHRPEIRRRGYCFFCVPEKRQL